MSLSRVHAQLSSKVQLLQALAPRLAAAGGRGGGGGGQDGDMRAAATVAAAAAALAEAGARAAQEVNAAAQPSAPRSGRGGGDAYGGQDGSGEGEEIQAHLVRRMQAIHDQLRHICSDMLASTLDGAEVATAGSPHRRGTPAAEQGGSACSAPGPASQRGDAPEPDAERSWGSASASDPSSH